MSSPQETLPLSRTRLWVVAPRLLSPRNKLVVPKVEPRDDIDRRSHPLLHLLWDTRKKMKKTPTTNCRTTQLSMSPTTTKGTWTFLGQFGLDSSANENVREEALEVAKLNAKFEQKIKEKMVEAAEEDARNMSVFQEELRASNPKIHTIIAMLSRLMDYTWVPSANVPIPS